MGDKYNVETTVTKRKNPQTGQVEEIETKKVHRIKIKADDEFFMTYIKFMSPLYELKYADDIKLMAKMCEWCDWETGMVYVTSKRRKEIIDTLGMHKSNISASIKRIKEKRLIDGQDGEYMLNPTVFWRGSKASRMEIMRKEGIQVQFNFEMEGDIKPVSKPTEGIQPNENY